MGNLFLKVIQIRGWVESQNKQEMIMIDLQSSSFMYIENFVNK